MPYHTLFYLVTMVSYFNWFVTFYYNFLWFCSSCQSCTYLYLISLNIPRHVSNINTYSKSNCQNCSILSTKSEKPSKTMYLRIDCNFCSVHEKITSIRLCTTWLRLFQMNRTNNYDQSLKINSNFFCCDIEKYINFFKIRQIIGK